MRVTRRSIALGAAVCAVAAALAARAWLWTSSRSGLRHPDTYPAPTVPVPAGTHVVLLSQWVNNLRTEARIRIEFPPTSDAPGGSAYTGLLTAVSGDTGHVVLLAGEQSDDDRRWALTRPGQRCFYVPDLAAPSDSLIVLLTAAVESFRQTFVVS